jgi:preprotein translocase subunit SecF
MDLKGLYLHHYKKMFWIPVFLVVIALGILVMNVVNTGDLIDKDVSLKGGTTLTVYGEYDIDGLESRLLSDFPTGDVNVRTLSEFASDVQIGFVIEASDIDDGELLDSVENFYGQELTSEDYSIEIVGSALGESFYKQMMIALVLAFLFMGIVVLITFRTFIPSVAVIGAAFADIVITLAILVIFNVKLSTSGIAALLLLIGYSIDTDILLTTKLLKRKEGRIIDRLFSAMKTGLTMTTTTVVALSIAYIVTTSLVLKQMFLIIIVGLLIDVIYTYAMNAGVLVWYVKRRKVR